LEAEVCLLSGRVRCVPAVNQFVYPCVHFGAGIAKGIGQDGNRQNGIRISEKDLGIRLVDFIKRLLRKQRFEHFFIGFDAVDFLTELCDLVSFAQFGEQEGEGEDGEGVYATDKHELNTQIEEAVEIGEMEIAKKTIQQKYTPQQNQYDQAERTPLLCSDFLIPDTPDGKGERQDIDDSQIGYQMRQKQQDNDICCEVPQSDFAPSENAKQLGGVGLQYVVAVAFAEKRTDFVGITALDAQLFQYE